MLRRSSSLFAKTDLLSTSSGSFLPEKFLKIIFNSLKMKIETSYLFNIKL